MRRPDLRHREEFIVKPGTRLHLDRIDPAYKGWHESPEKAAPEIAASLEQMDRLQNLLYADAGRSLLVVPHALDAAGKDGVIRHLFTGMNPQGTRVVGFKQPSAEQRAHDFLWRVPQNAPARGEVVIYNRSHDEDVLVIRVHELVPRETWSRRYDLINDFETMLVANGTRVLKFYLHISADEQLDGFKQRLDNPQRHWKISENYYDERALWPRYTAADEDAIERTSTDVAPWFVIPANHKWFRNLAIARIISDTMEDIGLKLPPPRADLDEIRNKYHAAADERTLEKGWEQPRGRARSVSSPQRASTPRGPGLRRNQCRARPARPGFAGGAHAASRGVTHPVASHHFCGATALTAAGAPGAPVADAVAGAVGPDGLPGAAVTAG